MNWAYLSLICTGMLIAQALLQRTLANRGYPSALLITLQSALAALILFLIDSSPLTFLTLHIWGILALAALFSFVGGIAEVEAIRRSPNPGYATAIVASIPVVTTILSPILNLGMWPGVIPSIGIFFVMLGCIIVALERSTNPSSTYRANWWIYAILSMFMFSFMALCLKYVSNSPAPVLAINLLAISSVFGLISLNISNKLNAETPSLIPINPAKVDMLLIILLGAVCGISVHTEILALSESPNPGLVMALLSLKAPAISLLAIKFFAESSLSKRALFSVFLSAFGAFLVSFD